MENNENYQQVNKALTPATGGFTFSLATVTYILFSLIVSLIIGAAKIEQWSTAYIYLMFLASPVALCVAIIISWRLRKFSLREVFPVKCHPKYYLIALMLVLGLLFSLNWVNEVTVRFFELFGYKRSSQSAELNKFLANLSGATVIPALLVIAVLPAVMEELLMRGVILNSSHNGMGTINTIFIIGFCFSIFHTSIEQTVYQFIAGCVFAFIAIRSGSILPSILMHFINNGLIVVLGACKLFDVDGNLMISSGWNIALTVIGAVCLVGGLVWLILDKKPFQIGESGGVKTFFLYASAGIVLLLLMLILSLFGL